MQQRSGDKSHKARRYTHAPLRVAGEVGRQKAEHRGVVRVQEHVEKHGAHRVPRRDREQEQKLKNENIGQAGDAAIGERTIMLNTWQGCSRYSILDSMCLW